ncbi:hypothetical protein [Mycolicibacterium sphagni]|uniref:DUF4267 domain-containing protein n=1 Tax=Mycolicibacterium sphagni TaxID=1786 RepID=A0A255DDH6_9MYCO|nr:hypothetical protein [Mycolicibacterium sphagni]OYN77478.1 hypothetical protein CG716_18255 [Mycolicibacterium sphagni]
MSPRLRSVEIVRGLWGAALLAAPATVLTRVHGVEVDSRAVVVARILGARHLAQATLSGLRPSPEVLAAGTWVDGVHAVTAFGLAAVDSRRARAGITDGVVAALWALFGLRDLTTGTTPPPAHERRRDALATTLLPVLPGGRWLEARAHDARATRLPASPPPGAR